MTQPTRSERYERFRSQRMRELRDQYPDASPTELEALFRLSNFRRRKLSPTTLERIRRFNTTGEWLKEVIPPESPDELREQLIPWTREYVGGFRHAFIKKPRATAHTDNEQQKDDTNDQSIRRRREH